MSLTVSSMTDMSILFSGLGSSSSSSSSTGLSSLSSILSDYSSIRNGSYYKLLKAYYADDSDGSKASSTKSAISGTSGTDTQSALTRMNTTASSLKTDTYELMRTGSKSLFKTEEVENEDGTVEKKYDTDAIYKSVKSFVDHYNSVVEQADSINNSSIKRATINMINTTSANEKNLMEIGITIGSDYQLTIDEDIFKDADMSKVQSLFQGSSSYGSQVSGYSSSIMNYAVSAINSGGTYSSSGLYTSADLVGSLFSGSY